VSFFANVEQVPGDPILGLTEAYNADSRPTKVNLGVGIYYDENGRIPLLRAVKQYEQQLVAEAKPRGYLPIDGLPAYTLATQKLVFGEGSDLLAAGRVATSQTIGGSGALRVGADLLRTLPWPSATRAGKTTAPCSAPPVSTWSITPTSTTPPTAWISPAWSPTCRSCSRAPWCCCTPAATTRPART
jgi:hypothetical protein